MGRCQCRKLTNFYCWHCNQSVCFDCVVEDEHRLAYVSTYQEWVEKGCAESPPQPKCPLSGKLLTEKDDVIRFMNFQIYDIQAINSYGASLPKNTALNGFKIPGTDIPMVSILPKEANTKLAQQIRKKLKQFTWISELIDQAEAIIANPTVSPPSSSPASPTKPISTNQGITILSPDDGKRSVNRKILTDDHSIQIDLSNSSQTTTTQSARDVESGDADDKKYKRRPIRSVFEALGFVSSTSNNTARTSQPYLITGRRLVFLFLLVATLMVVFFLSMNIEEALTVTVEETFSGENLEKALGEKL
eukprot:TRINITY_DN7404_c0_g1_i1.p1 TRINITY_DN7404_c0_g1~~TRINITY_DN7404_c0_g1_i1.p1  ORF type:complete len:304 (-),score=44.23 TRINITY_DN7404_c0_g1_i1:66-977(-)